ncbi:hypothetical protein FAZ69_13125 [Trinickia terrae]|uniref:DUF481 domain-containing protein n=1 Tax=Trinickia terrae TaxID=2571161 RepID=A0A4U1I5R1_9BURK|nr:hypothetical protein [Trinickia terrae]TKC88693.1 hypothetical protein FAZ69_13125 [Trinickia terrae]
MSASLKRISHQSSAVERRLDLPFCLAALCLAAAACPAHADAAPGADALLSANNQLSVSIGGHRLDYTESTATVNPLDSETGTQLAYRIAAVRQGSVLGLTNVYLSAAVSYAAGTTAYDGYLEDSLGNLYPYQSTTHDKTADVSIKLGRAFSISPFGNAQLVPYIAYGYHSWVRDSSDTQYGYYEHYRHQTVSAGLIGQYAFTPRLVGSADISVGRTFGAKMTASIVSGTFNLGAKPVVTGMLGLDYAVTKRLHINASYQVTRFNYGMSNTVGGYYEPDSKTTEQLYLIGIGYSF